MSRPHRSNVILRFVVRRNAAVAIHRALAGVVARQRQRHVAAVAIQQPAQVARAAVDVLGGIVRR